MIAELESPFALASIRWRSAAEGGRRSGPPTATVYAANCLFADDPEVAGDAYFSVLVQKRSSDAEGVWSAAVDFLARDIARPHVRVGVSFFVMEGPRAVADAEITDLFDGAGSAAGPG
ncbi:MAG: hypothetical protein QM809_18740 [Gordonia sp. (in: high G+C Gram-positive bacteria)]|uniref:hypothetical protein n=1 Tax=Gordonia sp. (in: high G+C Gram-positive bacteria) TaxID=84139 RepID=UPI0039E6C796